MPKVKRSALKETRCLIATMIPIMLAEKSDPLTESKNIEGLYRYAIDLFDGIARNEANDFCGKFDLVISLTPEQFLAYKKLSGKYATKQEYEEFMTAVAILQMTFIDENIYLTGDISEETLYISKDGITWGYNAVSVEPIIKLSVNNELSNRFARKFIKSVNGINILDFLSTVYRFKPFKEEKGNMMRHIVNPINSVRKNNNNEERLSYLIEYCRAYIKERNFDILL